MKRLSKDGSGMSGWNTPGQNTPGMYNVHAGYEHAGAEHAGAEHTQHIYANTEKICDNMMPCYFWSN